MFHENPPICRVASAWRAEKQNLSFLGLAAMGGYQNIL
jgi:hypothetical protein